MKKTIKKYAAFSKDGKQVLFWDSYSGKVCLVDIQSFSVTNPRFIWEEKHDLKSRLMSSKIEAVIRTVIVKFSVSIPKQKF